MKAFSRYEIAEVIAEELGLIVSDIAPIGPYSNFSDVDEFDMMNLCAELETKFRDIYDFFEAMAVNVS